jgi:hypothetical protein
MAATGYVADSCVNWGQFTVPQLWEMVAGEGDATTYQQVSAWRQAHDAISAHASTLRKCRADLVASWPPERSDAAAAFVTHIDKLLANLDIMAGVAATNSQALHGIANALAGAKDQLKPIHEEWQRKDQATRTESAVGKALDTLTFWSDEDAWKSELQDQAYRVMASTDTQVAEHRGQMRVPAPYGGFAPHDRNDLTPGFQPFDASDSIGSSPGGRLMSAPTIPLQRSQPVLPGGAPADRHDSIDLAGSPTSTSVVEHGPTLPDLGSGRVIAPPSGGPILIPGISSGLIDGVPGGVDRWASSGPARTAAVPGRLVGRGGVIGGPADGGRASSAAVRPNGRPFGGVIDDQHGGMPITAAAGGVRPVDRRRGQTRLHPDDVWPVAQGGPSVLRPGEEPGDHDPGPGVLGLDR